jgi:prolyl oligopeptidase
MGEILRGTEDRTMRGARIASSFLALVGVGLATAKAKLEYPTTKALDLVEEIHGQKVPDPYRWLEDDVRTSSDVRAWVEAQNKVTFGYLAAIPGREALGRRLTELWNYERYSPPGVKAGRYYYFKNDGLQNQSVLYVAETLDGAPRIVLDPNTWSKDGTVALAGLAASDDGRYLAYARSGAGSDWQDWYVRDLSTGQDLDDRLRWTKFTNAAWTADGKGFFYCRFAEPAVGQEFKALNTNQKVFYHRVGTAQADDVLVYERPDEPDWGFAPTVSEDGRWLVLASYVGTDPRNRVFYKDLLEPYGTVLPLVDTIENEYTFLGNDGPLFYFKTDLGAPRGRIVAIDTRAPRTAEPRELIPESPDALQGVNLVGNLFVATYLHDAATRVRTFRIDGTHVRDVELPGTGSAGGFGGRRSDVETFYAFSGFQTPDTIYRYDLLTGESRLWRRPKVGFDPDQYEVRQVFFPSKDGTRIPMFLTHRKGLTLDGNRPTLLYGYGGFGISLTPSFSVTHLAWMELGGVYAVANLRGGGEYGEAWHDAGKLEHKQNVFDDFIAAAEWLVANQVTKPARLAIQGGSNGGLLVGACIVQRPDLFGAALPAVGVMDMLRFEKFTAGRYWVDDYGSVADAQQFRTLYAYSPYHNLKPGVRYPATLITTADTDDRVVPGHSFKFAAALQRAQAGDAPVLIRIETSAGHGGGKPTAKIIEEAADEWAFLMQVLGVAPPGSSGGAATAGR